MRCRSSIAIGVLGRWFVARKPLIEAERGYPVLYSQHRTVVTLCHCDQEVLKPHILCFDIFCDSAQSYPELSGAGRRPVLSTSDNPLFSCSGYALVTVQLGQMIASDDTDGGVCAKFRESNSDPVFGSSVRTAKLRNAA